MTTDQRDEGRPRRSHSRRARAAMSLGVVAVVAAGFSVKGTFAFWTDSATMQTGSFTSGTLDITLGGQLVGNGGTWTNSSFSLANMVPGESQAVHFAVANNGSVGLTYTVAGTATGALAPQMQFSVYPGTSSNTGTGAAGNRAGTCTGTALASNQVLAAAPTTLVGTPRTLAAAPPGSENVCVIARLNPSATNAAQGQTMTASLVFAAQQLP